MTKIIVLGGFGSDSGILILILGDEPKFWNLPGGN